MKLPRFVILNPERADLTVKLWIALRIALRIALGIAFILQSVIRFFTKENRLFQTFGQPSNIPLNSLFHLTNLWHLG